MTTKRCLECGDVKPQREFDRAKAGRDGRASRCKSCVSNWHHANYLKKKMNDPAFMKQNAIKARMAYAELTRAAKKRMMKRISEYRKTLPNAALTKNLRRALKRHPTVNHVSLKELLDIFKKQDGRCAVSGITMTWAQGAYNPTSMSIDRLDCTKGYMKNNVRLVCFQVNAFRGRWSDSQMLEMAEAIVKNMKKTRRLKVG